MSAFVIADPGIAAALLSGRKTEMRVLAQGPLATAVPGDRIQVRESVIPARMAGGKIHATSRRRAEFAIFADGWRQHRDGSHERGRRPTDEYSQWIGPMYMPDWATRLTLTVESVGVGRLSRMTRAQALAEGVAPVLGGLLWRWPRPIRGHYRDPRQAFRAYWDLLHGPGDRWADDPDVVTIGFRVSLTSPSARPARARSSASAGS